VPEPLITTALQQTNGLIFGVLPQEFIRDEDKARYNLEKMNSITNQRKEAGWILLEGFLSLGRSWIKASISKILRFFKSVFRKENCSIN
jgi:hypothetical protein